MDSSGKTRVIRFVKMTNYFSVQQLFFIRKASISGNFNC